MRMLTLAFIVCALLGAGGARAAAAAPRAPTAEAQLIALLNQVRSRPVTCPGSGVRPPGGPLQAAVANAQAAMKQATYMAGSGIAA